MVKPLNVCGFGNVEVHHARIYFKGFNPSVRYMVYNNINKIERKL